MAGAATSNITPELGGEVVGGVAPYPCTHIHDELHARCLVLDDGKTKLALVVCDVLGMHRSVSVTARELIEKETGIPAANVLISGTHTHSAVNVLGGPVRFYASDLELTDYQKFVARRIADGVRRAINLLRPADQVAGLVVEPEAPPFLPDLAQIFGLIQQLLHPAIRLAGVLVDQATAVAKYEDGVLELTLPKKPGNHSKLLKIS